MLLESRTAKEFLNEELARRLRDNSRYSLRAFARQLGLSPGELSEVLRGKRALSFRSTLRIAKSLGLNSAETRHLLQIAQTDKSRAVDPELLRPLDQAVRTQDLSVDMFRVVSDWYCFAIL